MLAILHIDFSRNKNEMRKKIMIPQRMSPVHSGRKVIFRESKPRRMIIINQQKLCMRFFSM